jgi:hypothetical protein
MVTLDMAWKMFEPTPKNAETGRRLMASAIIRAIEAGVVEPTILVDKAVRALRAAIREEHEALDTVAARRARRRSLDRV